MRTIKLSGAFTRDYRLGGWGIDTLLRRKPESIPRNQIPACAGMTGLGLE